MLVSEAVKPRINHIGVAVPSISAYVAQTEVLLGSLQRGPLITNDRQQVREMFLTDGSTVFELLEPIGDKSPLNSFLRRNPGGGLIHFAVDVDALEPTLELLERVGGRVLIAPVPDVAFEQRRIAFVLLAGQVIELIERAKGA